MKGQVPAAMRRTTCKTSDAIIWLMVGSWEGFYPELFPKDYPERLERLVELIGLTWGEFAERLGVSTV